MCCINSSHQKGKKMPESIIFAYMAFLSKNTLAVQCRNLVISSLLTLPIQAQERTTLRVMLALKNPSAEKIYRITDADKQGDWRFDADDTESEPNVGTVLASSNRQVKGRFKRVFDCENGVEIDWFLTSPNETINDALLRALRVCEQINFSSKTYFLDSLTVSPSQLFNPNKLHFRFRNTTLQAKNGLRRVGVLQIKDIPVLALTGTLTLDGNAPNVKISNPLNEGGAAFLHIIAPKNNPQANLEIGSITIKNMPMCGVNIFTRNDAFDTGYDRITAKAFREINGFNHLNIQQEDFAIWGFNVRGAHRAVVIDSLHSQQDNEPWGDAPIEKPFYVFTFENQVDPAVHRRKDSLHVQNLYANYPCSIVFYTQAVNHVLVDNYVIENALRKPNVADTRVYPTLLKRNVSWIGSKHTWTSYKSPNSSFQVKKLLIRNSNPAFMNESVGNDLTGLWLNKGISGAVFDEIETDLRLKFYGDDYYFGFPDVPDGQHRVKKMVSHIAAKRNYVQSLNADLTIDSLHLAKDSGVSFAMGNAKIGVITQAAGSKAIFESRENRFKNSNNRHNGFIVGKCQATNIFWKFNWFISPQNLADKNAVSAGERYEFSNFSGNNFLQTHTNVSAPNGKSVYATAYRYDADAVLRASIQQFLNFVEFNWNNVSMKLADASPNDLTLRYLPVQSKTLRPLINETKTPPTKGWKTKWQPSRFTNCVIK